MTWPPAADPDNEDVYHVELRMFFRITDPEAFRAVAEAAIEEPGDWLEHVRAHLPSGFGGAAEDALTKIPGVEVRVTGGTLTGSWNDYPEEGTTEVTDWPDEPDWPDDDGGGAGVREPRRPRPTPSSSAADPTD
jgi:hypothetical protein